ncbi:MAG: replication initiator protein A [Acidobacteriaceae bacterium]|nr:replication initiator protein A [Acidobacteriaceae bacterium]
MLTRIGEIELPVSIRSLLPAGRNHQAEKQQGALRYVDRVASIAENASVFANGRTDTEWILIARALADCPLPYRPTQKRQITKRTRFGDAWVKITFTCARPDVAMPYGADARLMHWLIDRAVQEGRRAIAAGKEPSRTVAWNSTYEYLRDIGASNGVKNYRRVRASFNRLSGLAITIECETASEERGKIIPFLDSWHLPKSAAPEEMDGRQALAMKQYGFTISEPLFQQAMKYFVAIPRPLWQLTKANPCKGALLLWAFVRAYAATVPSLIRWEVLSEQFWYDESSPWRVKQTVGQTAALLHALWPGASMTITDDGVVFNRAASPFLPDDPSKGRVRHK